MPPAFADCCEPAFCGEPCVFAEGVEGPETLPPPTWVPATFAFETNGLLLPPAALPAALPADPAAEPADPADPAAEPAEPAAEAALDTPLAADAADPTEPMALAAAAMPAMGKATQPDSNPATATITKPVILFMSPPT